MPKKRTHEEFIAYLFSINKNICVLGDYKNANTPIGCKCLQCGHIWYPLPNSLTSKRNGCPVCNNKIVVKGLNDMWTTNFELAELLADPNDGYKYTRGTHVALDWKCKQCGNIIKNKHATDVVLYGLSCPVCSDGISYPNKFAYNLLKQLNVDFIQEYSPNWIKPKRYDFYFVVNNKKYILEMDGEFHFKDNYMSGVTKEESLYTDSEKDRLANNHEIEVIRIDSIISDLNYLKNNVVNSKLAVLFDLTNIDWLTIESNIIKSRVIEACDLWNSGITSISEIAAIMMQGKTTIRRYLIQGNSIGVCNYNIEITRKNIGKSVRRKVVCVDNGIIFNSCSDAGRQYNIDISSIVKCCKEKQKTAGGFTWKYIDQDEKSA